jgi:DNA-binding NarL/FixJ family response regulator
MSLTAEQSLMLSAFAAGTTLGAVAGILNVSVFDAQDIEQSLYRRLCVTTRGDAIALADAAKRRAAE